MNDEISVAFFDLDKTLLDCNSGRLWLTREWREGRLTVRDAAWGAGMLFLYRMGMGDLESAFAQAAMSLIGMEETLLRKRTATWFSQEVVHRLRPGAQLALEQARSAGQRLVLATSSSIYAAEQACIAYGFEDQVSTKFEVIDGKFTGKIAESAFGDAKAIRVIAWAKQANVELAQCAFYTDSITDLALLEQVGKPVVVNPDHKLRKIAGSRQWPIVDWGFSSKREG